MTIAMGAIGRNRGASRISRSTSLLVLVVVVEVNDSARSGTLIALALALLVTVASVVAVVPLLLLLLLLLLSTNFKSTKLFRAGDRVRSSSVTLNSSHLHASNFSPPP